MSSLKNYIVVTLIISLIVSAIISLTIGYIALDHNPSQEFAVTDKTMDGRSIQWGHLLILSGTWFLIGFFFCISLAVVIFLIIKFIRRKVG